MESKIEQAILETLIIGNKQSIHIAVEKIMKIINQSPPALPSGEEAIEFAEWMLEHMEFIDNTTAGNVYTAKNRINDKSPCYTSKEAYAIFLNQQNQ